MSIALMTLAWKMGIATAPKMVLLALCDNANDQGECYPSIGMLATKCSMAERSVQKHLADMEREGIIVRAFRNGRSTLYQIDPRKLCTPADRAPPPTVRPTPAPGAPPPPQTVRPASATGAPITVMEPSMEPSGESSSKQSQPAAPKFCAVTALLDAGVGRQAIDDWLLIRKVLRAPLTATALEQLKREAAKAGMSLDTVVTLCCVRNWRGFQAAWVTDAGRPLPAPRSNVDKARNWASRLQPKGKSDDIVDINERPC